MKEKLHDDSPNLILKTIKTLSLSLLILLGVNNFGNAQNPNANGNGSDNANENATVDGGSITTLDGSTYIDVCVGDGIADYVDVTLEGESGRIKQWIITDEQNNILALPEAPPFDFDEAPPGNCRIWHLSYNGIKPLVTPFWHKHNKNLSDLKGKFDLSNYIEVERFQQPVGGTLEGGPFEFCVGDGEADHIAEDAIALAGNMGTNSTWVITDADGNILGLPDHYTDVNFDEADAGTCLVWYLSYEDNVSLDITNANELTGCFALTNPITVDRYEQPIAGILGGGPFEFCVGDGEADNITDGAITLSGNSGTNSTWVVTDVDGNILDLPDNYSEVNFDGAPVGTCFVWHLSYEDNVSFDDVTNASELTGCFALSNAITVERYQQPVGGTLEGGPFEFCVGDGEEDNILEGEITLSGNSGTNSTWVVTDTDGNILGAPDNYTDVNFDEAGDGTCLIWYLSYEDNVSLEGVENASELTGCFALTNPITVNRTEINGGTISGGEEDSFSFTVGDGEADKIAADAITLEGNVGANSTWVVTNEEGTIILGLPENYSDVDFDESGAGTCKIWHLSYEDGLEGLTAPDEGDHLVSGLTGACFHLSNAITVERTEASGKVAIFPNPTKEEVNVSFSSLAGDEVNISVFNLRNMQLSNKNYSPKSKNAVLDVSKYDNGIYFVVVTNNKTGEQSIKRLIVN